MLEQVKAMYHNHPVRTIALGVGAVVLAPAVFSLLKPVAKATIKTGVILYQKTRGTLAETGEQLGDLVAEAKAEILAEQTQKNALVMLNSKQGEG